MPLKECSVDGVKGWKWGNEGKCYTGEGAKEKAMKQGRAVEASKHAVSASHDIIYVPPDDIGAWSLASKEEHAYIKEAIYEGDFKLPGGADLKVTPDVIEHWVDTFKDMTENGVGVPLPLGHKTDAEANRGKIVNMYSGTNPQGKKALYLKTQFRDEEAAKLAKTSQVSIFSPPEFVDGKGNRYVRPITHVALTDYPVIPALQGFQSIAASFVNPGIKENDMPLKDLAKRLSIECENDEQLEDSIAASFEALQSTVASKDEEIKTLKSKIPSDPLTVTASHKAMLKDNRTLKLDRLVGPHISTAVRDELVSLFCSEESLTLSLSSEAGDGGLFDKLIEVLGKNTTIPLGEGGDVVALSKEDLGNPEKNPLLADVQRRVEAFK